MYFVFGFVIRVVLYWDSKRNPEAFKKSRDHSNE
jgi:hypothetical protein